MPGLSLSDWRYSVDAERIAWAVFDRDGSSANALGARPLKELGAIVDEVEKGSRDGSLCGLVLMSGKARGFIVGADIGEFESLKSEREVRDALRPVLALFDRIEQLRIPVVAAVHGVCVGGGLELILACGYRIATRDDATRIGFPEVKLGIFPGWNGTVRSIQQAGPVAAMRAMLTGSMMTVGRARAIGFIDELVDSPGSLRWAARKAVLEKRSSRQAGWLSGVLLAWPLRELLARWMRAETRKKARPEHYPAPYRLIDLFAEHGGDLSVMKRQEPHYFAPLLVSDQSRNLRRVFRLTELLKSQAPRGLKWRPRRVHVIGAGTMGADIAGWCVASGMEVTLQDLSIERIEKGQAAQESLIRKKFATGALQEAARTRLIADPTGDGVAHADVVIEAVVERLDVKQKVFQDLEGRLKADAVLATNTSSLQLEDIAEVLKDPTRLVGLHFFNPVAKMQLVEVVRGDESRAQDIGRACAFVTALGKFPLVTKSAPGFLVNRVLAPYMMGALGRLDDGIDKELIDEAAAAFGMPMGPIELADIVGLDICADVGQMLGVAAGGAQLAGLLAEGHLGKKSGQGFYIWKDGKPVRSAQGYDATEVGRLGQDLVAPLINAAEQALAEGIVETADYVDAGVIFGTGFAPFRGGPLYYASQIADQEPSVSSASPAGGR